MRQRCKARKVHRTLSSVVSSSKRISPRCCWYWLFFFFLPSHLLSSPFCSLSLLVVTQIRGHIAGSSPLLITTVRASYISRGWCVQQQQQQWYWYTSTTTNIFTTIIRVCLVRQSETKHQNTWCKNTDGTQRVRAPRQQQSVRHRLSRQVLR